MPWLLVSSGQQQPWYSLCKLASSLSYMKEDFNFLCHVSVKEWWKFLIHGMGNKSLFVWSKFSPIHWILQQLTHWGRVTHICVSKIITIGSDNGLSPGRRQAIIWTNAGILLIESLGTNFSEILIEIRTFSFKKIHLKMSSGNGGHFVSASMC